MFERDQIPGRDKIIIPSKYKSKQRRKPSSFIDPNQILLQQLFNVPNIPAAPRKTVPGSTVPEKPFEERIVIPRKYQHKGEGEHQGPSLGGDEEMTEMEKTLLHKISYPPLFQERPPIKKPPVYKVCMIVTNKKRVEFFF